MVRRLLWVEILSSFLAMFCQAQQAQPAGLPPTTQVFQGPVYVPAMPVTSGGYYAGYVGGGLYGITTPTASFASPNPTAGISLADRAGISTSSPIGIWVPSTLPPNTLVFTNVQPVVTEMALPEAETGALQGPVTAPRPNLGPSRWGGAAHVGAAPAQGPAPSLGEVSAQHRTGAPPTIRRYTNADVQRILSTMPLRGINVNQRLQQQQAQPPAQPAPPPATAPRPQPKAAPSPGSERPRAAE
jgi:hypothetical protein